MSTWTISLTLALFFFGFIAILVVSNVIGSTFQLLTTVLYVTSWLTILACLDSPKDTPKLICGLCFVSLPLSFFMIMEYQDYKIRRKNRLLQDKLFEYLGGE